MKTYLIIPIICCMLLSTALQAQKETSITSLFGNESDSIQLGWIVNPQIKSFANHSSVQQNSTTYLGGKVALLINRNWQLGLSGYAKTGKFTYNVNQLSYGMGMGYGGLYVGYRLFPGSLLHPTIGISGGYGGALEYSNINGRRGATSNTAGFIVIEPEAGIEINISKSIKLTAQLSYRYIDDAKFDHLNKDQLNGFSLQAGLAIGSF